MFIYHPKWIRVFLMTLAKFTIHHSKKKKMVWQYYLGHAALQHISAFDCAISRVVLTTKTKTTCKQEGQGQLVFPYT